MELFPTSVGTRPRLACEVRPEGVVVARGDSPTGTLAAVARVELRPGLVLPGLKAGNLPERPAVAAALRRALDSIAARGADRSRYLTLILPDACVRVLLLDFETLPSKPAEALPVVRFRLKKLLPFDVEHALVSFQTMSSERSLLRVLAVAIPQEVLAEYEALVTDAGMQPGVVLPSTLAALAGLDPANPTALVLNVSSGAVTTAIVQSGILLLHRSVELYPAESASAGSLTAPSAAIATYTAPILSNGAEARAERSAARLASPENRGNEPYIDPAQHPPLPLVDRHDTAEEWSRPESAFEDAVPALEDAPLDPDIAVALLNTAPDGNNRSRDLAESVSVAAAYFEDTLGTAPDLVLSAGTTTAPHLYDNLVDSGMAGLRVHELLDLAALGPGVTTAVAPHGWLAGVRGALRS